MDKTLLDDMRNYHQQDENNRHRKSKKENTLDKNRTSGVR